MQTFRDLIVWQKSKKFVVFVYKVTEKFPKSELFSLTDQLRRASISIPSNIAEGYRRSSQKEFYQFLRIAYGSSAEVETQIDIAKDLGYLSNSQYQVLLTDIQEIVKMLTVLLKKVELNK